MIVDIHSYIKKSPAGQEEEEKKFLLDMEKNGINSRVVSTLDGWPIKMRDRYISKLVSTYLDRLADCAVINPKKDSCAETVRKALEPPGTMMSGFNSMEHGYYPDAHSGTEDVLAVTEERRAPVKVFIGVDSRFMPQQWLGHVRRHPDLVFLFLHTGCFDYEYGCTDPRKEIPNTYLETPNQYEVQTLKRAVTSLPKGGLAFGPSYPERLTRRSLNMFDISHLDETYRECLSGKNDTRILGLD